MEGDRNEESETKKEKKSEGAIELQKKEKKGNEER